MSKPLGTESSAEVRRAMRRALRDLAWRYKWLWVICIPLGSWGALKGRPDESLAMDYALAVLPLLIMGPTLSAQVFRMLPLSRNDLAKAIWRVTVFFSVIIVAALIVTKGVYSAVSGDPWEITGIRSLYSFAHFLMLVGYFGAATTCLERWRRATARDTDGAWKDSGLVVLMPLMMWNFAVSTFYENHAWTIILINLFIGFAGVVISYRLRENLLDQFPRTALAEGGTDPFSLALAPPGRERWEFALLRQMSSYIAWSACVATLTIVVSAMTLLIMDGLFQAGDLAGLVIGASLLSLCAGWWRWREESRAWRMLPIDYLHCEGALVVFTVAASVVPWALAFACAGLIAVFKDCLTLDAVFSLLGVSLVAQGMLLPLFPLLLRGYGNTVRGAVYVAIFVAGLGCIFNSRVLSLRIEGLLHTGLAQHGWAWMGEGVVVLGAGMIVATLLTERVLRHRDCYAKATDC